MTTPSIARARTLLRYMPGVMLAIAVSVVAPAAASQKSGAPCAPSGPAVSLPGLSEASGLAASRAVPGRLWTHNDSGQPIVFALDARGTITARIHLTGATVEDWEAIAVGPCPAGSCLYVGDIGDNSAARKRVTIYRAPEPKGSDASIAVTDIFHATYPDGAHDAETLLVTPAGEIYIVTKGETGAVALYRFPKDLRAGATHTLEQIGSPLNGGKTARTDRVTDGAVSADGAWVVLRTGQRLTFYKSDELLKGSWRAERTVDLRSIGEAQGEGVAVAADRSVYLAGEGGGKSRPGSFVHLTCMVDR